MFPAPAGMSPVGEMTEITIEYVPRTRGDEPNPEEAAATLSLFSPHLRG